MEYIINAFVSGVVPDFVAVCYYGAHARDHGSGSDCDAFDSIRLLESQAGAFYWAAWLSAMGIEPLGALDRAPSLVEKRTWSPNAKEMDDVDDTLNAAIQGN